MIYAHDYAPNLFKSYEDWHDTFVNELGMEPDEYLKNDARNYFENEEEE